MTIPEALEKISQALAKLAFQTQAETQAGLYSKNRLAEDLLLPVFQISLKAPHQRNLNQKGSNFPYIDLADDVVRLAIQVTTERTAAKVTDTLSKFIQKGYQKQYDRLIFFILTGDRVRYAASTKSKWQTICKNKLGFKPTSDIITILDLFSIIQGLPHLDIYALHDIFAHSVAGEAYVDIDSHLTRLSRRQLEYEKKSGKYIPDIFVETRDTKTLARNFSHPVLFFRRTLDSLYRLDVTGWNNFLTKMGLPSLPFPNLATYGSEQTLPEVEKAAAELPHAFVELSDVLDKYEHLSHKGDPPFPVKKDRRYYYDENTFTLQSSLGWGFSRSLKDLVTELAVIKARVFILTGRAGQGKTNMVCDFVENFLFNHKIPCAYLTGRILRSMHAPDLGDAVQRLLFEGKTSSFADAARLLSQYASRVNKPFVLIIDGINEHHRISEFAEQLEQFIQVVLEHPYLNVLLTCRSEFFHHRFGILTTGSLKPHVFLLEANEARLEDEVYDEMLASYFHFFRVNHKMVSQQVVESLKKDFLLLRFFCEAYGAKNKPNDYQQPFIAHIYREEIFTIYLNRKLGTADLFLRHISNKLVLTGQIKDLLAVLRYCVGHMLETWQFVNVPVSAIPANLNNALYALLDEDLILRRDAPPGLSIFSESEA